MLYFQKRKLFKFLELCCNPVYEEKNQATREQLERKKKTKGKSFPL